MIEIVSLVRLAIVWFISVAPMTPLATLILLLLKLLGDGGSSTEELNIMNRRVNVSLGKRSKSDGGREMDAS